MNDETYNPESLDELPGDLRAAVERRKRPPVPEAAMQRALDRAARCGSPMRWTDHRLRQKAVLGFAAAVAVCVVLGLWFLPPSDMWADVVKAVQAERWIHGAFRGSDPGQSSEFWISTPRASFSSRSKEQVSFFDERLRIVYRYEPQKGDLYRLPASGAALEGQFLEIFQGLFRGDAELKTAFSGMILKDQKRRQTKKDGQEWDEYELHFLIPSRPNDDVRMTFVVDARTHLPHSMTMKDVGSSREFTFDYPENGPADIYALGVPKDARLVDRVPTGDMSRMVAGIQAGRDRFDDFHAIVIQNWSPDSSPGPRAPLMANLVWKKGNRWRVEAGVRSVHGRFPPNKDKLEWAREASKNGFFKTINVCDGKAIYEGDFTGAGNFALVATAAQAPSMSQSAWKVMPASWCYPITFPSPNDRNEEVVNPKPSEGPPHTILVTSRLVDVRGLGLGVYRFQRFWLDPMRDYAVVRNDVLQADPAVKPPTDHDYQGLMDQWEQTPNGVWYATRVRTGPFLNEQKASATWYHFFLDFKSDMPDDLFKPAKRTVLTDRYPVGS